MNPRTILNARLFISDFTRWQDLWEDREEFEWARTQSPASDDVVKLTRVYSKAFARADKEGSKYHNQSSDDFIGWFALSVEFEVSQVLQANLQRQNLQLGR